MDAGRAYIVFGKLGFSEVNLAALTPAEGIALNGSEAGGWFGLSVSGAGDVNADGIDDVVIAGALEDGEAGADSGRTWVVFGTKAPVDIDMGTAAANGQAIAIDGGEAGAGIGSVTGAGDINGDGFADIVAGSGLSDAGGPDAGQTTVVFGADYSSLVTHQGTDGDDTLTGTADADVIVGGQGDDTILGGGGDDVISAGAGDDLISVGAGNLSIDGGSGVDTVLIEEGGIFDLDPTGGTRISGVETIDSAAGADNTLVLSFDDLLDMTEVDNTLTILGDNGDTVNADLSGHTVKSEDHGAFTRYVIDGGVAVLDVDNEVQQNITGDMA